MRAATGGSPLVGNGPLPIRFRACQSQSLARPECGRDKKKSQKPKGFGLFCCSLTPPFAGCWRITVFFFPLLLISHLSSPLLLLGLALRSACAAASPSFHFQHHQKEVKIKIISEGLPSSAPLPDQPALVPKSPSCKFLGRFRLREGRLSTCSFLPRCFCVLSRRVLPYQPKSGSCDTRVPWYHFRGL